MHRQPPPKTGLLHTSLRARLTLGVLLPLLLLLGGITIWRLDRHRENILTGSALAAGSATRALQAGLRQAFLHSDFAAVQAMLDDLSREGNFHILYLLDPEGRVLFAPGGQDVGIVLSNQAATCRTCHDLPEEQRPVSVVLHPADGEPVFRSMVPLENEPACQPCHADNGQPLALLLSDMPIAALEEVLRQELWENVAWSLAAMLLAIGIVNLALSRFVLQRLRALRDALAAFKRGRRDVRLPVKSADEIAQLAEAFNAVSAQIVREEREKAALAERVRRESTLRGELLRKLITAQEDERRRLAAEIHDQVGQSLGGLTLQLEALLRRLPPEAEAVRAHVSHLQALVSEAADSMYDLIFDLRPAALDDLGLPAALRTLAERTLQGTRLQFELQTDHYQGRLPPEMEIALYRIFQEGLNNAVRHSAARRVRLGLSRQTTHVEGWIEDDGKGFRLADVQSEGTHPRGFGLASMKERLAPFGGVLEIVSDYGQGTRLHFTVPLPPEENP